MSETVLDLPDRMRRLFSLAVVFLALCVATASGSPLLRSRVAHEFELQYRDTKWGESVFVLGSLPELGGGRMERAVKLEPTEFPLWRLTVQLPAGAEFDYRFVVREDGPGELDTPSNGRAVSETMRARTRAIETPPCHRLVSVAEPTRFTAVAVIGADGQVVRRVRLVAAGVRRAATGLPFRSGDVLELSSEGGEKKRFRTDAQAFYLSGDLEQGTWYPPPAKALSPSRIVVHEEVPSRAPGMGRAVRVYLPRGYEDSPAARYPVLFLQDGQNVFRPGGPFGCWDAERTLDRLIGRGEVPETICVGIDNTARRMTEYVPPYSAIDGKKGTADAYCRYVMEEVAPFVDGKYRTLQSRESRIVGGSSLGGLVSAYLGWHQPIFASRLLCMSPSFQLGEILELFESQPARDVVFYLDSGDSGPSHDGMGHTIHARDALLKGGKYVLGGTLFHRIAPGSGHNEAAWRERFGEALATIHTGAEQAARDGDIDGDGTVGGLDRELLTAAASGQIALYGLRAARSDLDGSGKIDRVDLELFEAGK